jgi:hypothetical protein
MVAQRTVATPTLSAMYLVPHLQDYFRRMRHHATFFDSIATPCMRLRGGPPRMATTIYNSLPSALLPASTQSFIELNERQGFSLARADKIQLIRE